MKMKFRHLCLLCTTIAVLSAFTGCTTSKDSISDAKEIISEETNKNHADSNKLIGNWRYQLNSNSTVSKYSFSSSGTFTYSAGDGMYNYTGTYSVSPDGVLTLSLATGNSGDTKVLEHLSSEEIVSAKKMQGYWGFDKENKLYIDSKEGYLKQ